MRARNARAWREARRAARSPNLSPRLKRRWLGLARRLRPIFVVYEDIGVGIGNPDAVAKVKLYDDEYNKG